MPTQYSSWISLVEQAVFRYPLEMDGWRAYRVEYSGITAEGMLWLPPDVNATKVEDALNDHSK